MKTKHTSTEAAALSTVNPSSTVLSYLMDELTLRLGQTTIEHPNLQPCTALALVLPKIREVGEAALEKVFKAGFEQGQAASAKVSFEFGRKAGLNEAATLTKTSAPQQPPASVKAAMIEVPAAKEVGSNGHSNPKAPALALPLNRLQKIDDLLQTAEWLGFESVADLATAALGWTEAEGWKMWKKFDSKGHVRQQMHRRALFAMMQALHLHGMARWVYVYGRGLKAGTLPVDAAASAAPAKPVTPATKSAKKILKKAAPKTAPKTAPKAKTKKVSKRKAVTTTAVAKKAREFKPGGPVITEARPAPTSFPDGQPRLSAISADKLTLTTTMKQERDWVLRLMYASTLPMSLRSLINQAQEEWPKEIWPDESAKMIERRVLATVDRVRAENEVALMWTTFKNHVGQTFKGWVIDRSPRAKQIHEESIRVGAEDEKKMAAYQRAQRLARGEILDDEPNSNGTNDSNGSNNGVTGVENSTLREVSLPPHGANGAKPKEDAS